MLELGEIFPTVAKENRAVELRVAADKVVVAGTERLAARFAPRLAGPEMAFQENCARIARFGDCREPLAALQDSDRCAAAASPAAIVAPPMPEPTMTTSGFFGIVSSNPHSGVTPRGAARRHCYQS